MKSKFTKKDTSAIESELNKFRLRDLESYKDSVVKYIEILPAPDSCSECQKWRGEKTRVEDALSNGPLPIKECSEVPIKETSSFEIL